MAAKTRKPAKPKKLPAGKWRESARMPAGAEVGKRSAAPASRSEPGHRASSHVLPPTGGGMAALEVMAGAGLSGVILELVGEGAVSLGRALDAFQREQDRVANRSWRRPGGLVRMGGL